MKRLLLALILLPTIALGQSTYPRDITIQITHPTTYVEDGSLIQDDDLRGTLVQCDRHDGEHVVDQEVPIIGLPGDVQIATLISIIPRPGTYSCVGFTVTVDGTMSDVSNVKVEKYTGKPNPPIVE